MAGFGGSWTFIITFLSALLAYSALSIYMGKNSWDPYPFILLNLFLSMLAAIQAPVIMMSQNRQDTKDRLRGELDYDVNRRAESEIQNLSRKLNLVDEKIDDIADEAIGIGRRATVLCAGGNDRAQRKNAGDKHTGNEFVHGCNAAGHLRAAALLNADLAAPVTEPVRSS